MITSASSARNSSFRKVKREILKKEQRVSDETVRRERHRQGL